MWYWAIAVLFIITSVEIGTASAETFVGTTSGGSLDVHITPVDEGFRMEFVNPANGMTQIHIDYTVSVMVGDEYVFGPIPLTHTTPGIVTIPATLGSNTSHVNVYVAGILFIPIDKETVTIDITIDEPASIPDWVKVNAGLWANDTINDDTFVAGIQYIITKGIIDVNATGSDGSNNAIPKWVKATAAWWASGELDDLEFMSVIEFLIERGDITIPAEPPILGGVDLKHAPAYGDTDAPIAIIEFGDYQCPNCRSWFENTRPAVLSEFVESGTAVLYFVDLVFIGPDSAGAAKASYCAEEQGMYWKYHDKLYQNQKGIGDGWASPASLENFAVDLGMDIQAYKSCILEDDGSRIEFNRMQAEAAGISRTPSFIIVGPNGTDTIHGNQPYSTFSNVISSLLE